ncbi:MAG: hypothetical protein ACRD29_16565 [Acidimicrobiales bacterium]
MRLDWRAIGLGMVVAIGIALPLALISQVVADFDDSSGGVSALVYLFFLLVLAGLAIGGFVAGSKRPEVPLTHGILAALAAYVLVQGVALVFILVRGDDVNLPALVFNAGLAAAMGLVGGWIANWRATRPIAEGEVSSTPT